MEAEVKRLARRRDGGDSEEEQNTKKTKNKSHPLEEELAKYEKSRGVRRKGQKKDESNVLAALAGFRTKLQTSTVDDEMLDASSADDEMVTQSIEGVEGEAGMEVDNDLGFMGHLLRFPKGNEEEVQKAEREYEVIDPRARGAQAKQEERERKAKGKGKAGGKRGRR
jgi:peptidyl-prolyl cis-trans isomerase SDCCAG10